MIRLAALAAMLGTASVAQAQIPVVTTLAGQNAGADTNGTAILLQNPEHLEADTAKGIIYVAQSGNGQFVRSITADSAARSTIITGTGYSFGSVNGGTFPFAGALTNGPKSVVRANDSIIYVAHVGTQAGSFNSGAIIRYNLNSGEATNIAGSNAGQGINGTGADIRHPRTSGMVFYAGQNGAADTLYVYTSAAVNQLIVGDSRSNTIVTRILATDNNVGGSSLPGNVPSGLAKWGNKILLSDYQKNRIVAFDKDGSNFTVVQTGLSDPEQMAVINDSLVYVALRGNGQIRKIDLILGTNTLVQGGLSDPTGLLVYNDTTMFVSEFDGSRIRRINNFNTPAQTIEPFAGNNNLVRNGPAARALFQSAEGTAVQGDWIYIADNQNDRIRRYNKVTQEVETFVGGRTSGANINGIGTDAIVRRPFSMLIADSILYWTENSRNDVFRVRAVNLNTRQTSTIQGHNFGGYGPGGSAVDGDTVNGRLRRPSGLAITSDRSTLYVGSSVGGNEGGASIRAINLATKVVQTVAGRNNTAGFADGDTSVARLQNPFSLALVGDTALYFSDGQNYRIRVLNLNTMTVTTLAGIQQSGGGSSSDANAGLSARLGQPLGITVDTAKRYLYFVENSGNRLRRMGLQSPNPVVTVAGAAASGLEDGVGLNARFSNPRSPVIDTATGLMYLFDATSNRLRQVEFFVNTPPTFELADTLVTVLENAGAVTVDTFATNISTGTTPADVDQTITFNVTASNPALFAVQPAISADGELSFTPGVNRYGMTEVRVIAQDNGGTEAGGLNTSDTLSFVIQIDSVNNAPVYTISQANSTINVLSNAGLVTFSSFATAVAASENPNFELNQALTFTLTSTNSSLYATGGEPSITLNAGTQPGVFVGSLSFEIDPTQTGRDSVVVWLLDNGGVANNGVDSAVGFFIINVAPFVNQAPTAVFNAANFQLVYGNTQTAPISIAPFLANITPGPATENSQTLSARVRSILPTMPNLYSTVPTATVTGNSATLDFTLNGTLGTDSLELVLQDNGGTLFGGTDTMVFPFTIRVFDPVSVHAQAFGTTVQAYPNPFTQQLNVLLPAGNNVVSITDLAGRTLSTATYVSDGSTANVMATPHMASGMYILQVLHEGQLYQGRLIKQ